MKNLFRGPVILLSAAVSSVVFASSDVPIIFDNPLPDSDVGAETKEILLKWHINDRKVPEWPVEVWNATDNELLVKTSVKTNEFLVTGLKPHRIYYAKVTRNWVKWMELCFTTGKVPAPAAAKMPERFGDSSRYHVFDMPRGEAYDLALTRFRGFSRIAIDRKNPCEFTGIIPCEMYSKAYVLCRIVQDPEKDRHFHLRITRHVTAPWTKFKGRAIEAMVNVPVDLSDGSTLKRTLCGDGLTLVEVPLDMGDIQDIIFRDQRGDYDMLKDELAAKGWKNYLDLELMGRTYSWRDSFRDMRADTDPNYVSAVTVYGVALEKSAADFETKCLVPGNIFANDEKPEGLAIVRLKQPGEYTLSLEAFDVDGRKVGEVKRPITESGEYRVAFPLNLSTSQPLDITPGWYRLVWRLADPQGVTITSSASAAVLGEDTRTTEAGEQYGTFIGYHHTGAHYRPTCKEQWERDYVGSILYKAGFRIASGMRNLEIPEADRITYKLAEPFTVKFPRDWETYCRKGGETNMIAYINQRLKENPRVRKAILFHEDAQVTGIAPEAFGFAYDKATRKAPKVAEQAAIANEIGAFMRKHFPDVKIVFGNSGMKSEFFSALLAYGFKPEYGDYMGSEAVGGSIHPEAPCHIGMNGLEHFREFAKRAGVNWGLEQCHESNFRIHTVIGYEKQASYYVRDIFGAYLWGCPTVFVGGDSDVGNHYNLSQWGNDGFCGSWPFVYPKPSYVAVATATKMLDRVTGLRKIPTGDDCVYAVEFTRADGKAVTAFWTSRGEILATVKGEGEARWSFSDMYGREMKRSSRLTISERVAYLLADTGAVASVEILSRDFPEDRRPSDYRVVAKCENAADWQLAAGPVGDSAKIQGPENDFIRKRWPHRTWTAATLKDADDPELGKCLEFELTDDGKSISPMHYRYNVMTLKKPIPIKPGFRTIGATVKGNSGWGDIHFVLQGASGRLYYSSERHSMGKLDGEARRSLDFTGWCCLKCPVKQSSPVRELSFGLVRNLWTEGDLLETETDLKLVGFVFSARFRPLILADNSKRVRQAVRIKDIGVCD